MIEIVDVCRVYSMCVACALSQKAKNMVKEATNMQKESKEAKKKFVAQETPMENASALSAHDHRYANVWDGSFLSRSLQ